MHRSIRLLAALTAALLLASGIAHARRFEFSTQQIRAVWTELRYVGGVQVIACPVTYEGSFHSRTISKVSGALIGSIYRAVIDQSRCTGGTEYYLNGEQGMPNTLPWHIRYDAFEGTLPRITGIRLQIVGLSWLVEGVVAFAGPCLFRTTAARPLIAILTLNAESRITSWRESESIQFPRAGGTGLNCPEEIGFPAGSGTITSPTGTAITVRLVA